MELPKITIVIPSFNQGAFLEETILSVLNQGYQNLELIIIDGGSTDNSVEIIKKYEKHLKYWVSEKDKGQSHAINKGLSKSSGEVFNWLCSDDTLASGSLERVGKAFRDHPGLLCYSGGLRKFNGQETLELYEPLLQGTLENTLRKRVIKQPSIFYGREALVKMGPLNEKLHFVMDVDWLLRFLFLFGTERIFEENDQVIANYRLHPQSKTITTIDKFTSEDSALLYSIAKLKGMTRYLHALDLKRESLEIEFPSNCLLGVENEVVNHLLFWFCLRKSTMLYKKSDFKFAKIFLSEISDQEIKLEEEEKAHLFFLNKYVRGKSWLLFCLYRAYEWKIKKKHLSPVVYKP